MEQINRDKQTETFRYKPTDRGWKKRSYFSFFVTQAVPFTFLGAGQEDHWIEEMFIFKHLSFFVTQAVPFRTSISRGRAGGPLDGRNVHILASLSSRPFHSGLPFLGAGQEDHWMEETFIF
jgi:hypothetical protein